MGIIVDEQTISLTNITGTVNSNPIYLNMGQNWAFQCVITSAAATAKTFDAADVSVADDTATIAAHGYSTGRKGQLTTTGSLPTGLSLATDYFIIAVDANTVAFASSLANALAGTRINITNQGSGTNTFTPTALAGGSVVVQKSNDLSNWTSVATPTNVTATQVTWLDNTAILTPTGLSSYIRLQYTLTAGQLATSNYLLIRE